eukprot:4769884-Heterocapsa_arctica.AAC.1
MKPEAHSILPKRIGLGTTALMPSQTRRQTKTDPQSGKGNLYVNRQKLCTYIQKTQEQILAQIQVVEAQP